jgi:hypothetical protein
MVLRRQSVRAAETSRQGKIMVVAGLEAEARGDAYVRGLPVPHGGERLGWQ